ncbi:MAG: amidohydrolase [Calditrichaeota bacterium]|nr:amidohydrolase [Calditrichota bacterium]
MINLSGNFDMKLDVLKKSRQLLHENAELSGSESKTAGIVRAAIKKTSPDQIIDSLGGKGIAAIYSGKHACETVLFRCELDALPIPETDDIEYKSKNPGISHKCGHDGHMAIMLGLAHRLKKEWFPEGRVVLLFQPSEETGSGARQVMDDPNFQTNVPIPNYVFALHNLPGFSLGEIIVRDNTFASASIGLVIELNGTTSHASEPQNGRSPAIALSQIIQALSSAPQFYSALHEACQVTIIHARLGEVAFGTSPGYGKVMATLRSHTSEVLESLKYSCHRLVKDIAKANELEFNVQWCEEFPATVNHSEAVEVIKKSAHECNLSVQEPPFPFPWSEDFGHFTGEYTGAMFGLGAGETHPALHHPSYDFPDELIESGVNIFEAILSNIFAKKNMKK